MPSEKRLRQREGRLARQEELRRAQQKTRQRRQMWIGGGFVILFAIVFYFFTRGGGSSKKVTTATTTTSVPKSTSSTAAGSGTTVAGSPTTLAAPSVSVPAEEAKATLGCPAIDGSSPRYTKFLAAPPTTCADPAKTYTATVKTDIGDIVIALDQKAAPKTVSNFIYLAGYHFYDGIVFHRAVPGFMDQTGDPTGTGSGSPGYTFADELPPSASAYKAGSVAMANSGPNTNGSQFFVVDSDQGGSQLQALYSLFGQVTSGMDVVTKINSDGAPDPGPPKVMHKMIKVTIAVT